MKKHNIMTVSKAAEHYGISLKKVKKIIEKFKMTIVYSNHCNHSKSCKRCNNTQLIDRSVFDNAFQATIDNRKALRDRCIIWCLFTAFIFLCAALGHYGVKL